MLPAHRFWPEPRTFLSGELVRAPGDMGALRAGEGAVAVAKPLVLLGGRIGLGEDGAPLRAFGDPAAAPRAPDEAPEETEQLSRWDDMPSTAMSAAPGEPAFALCCASNFLWRSPSACIRDSISARKFCCGPMTEPGRHNLSQEITSGVVTPYHFMRYNDMSVPVRPRPALQWTASPAPSDSTISRNRFKMASVGLAPSAK
mmetsp:Transcript_71417/g.141596  ORF Transcript_71417/g.141596 Transcript_71417/m.141596 type:complete len:201 (+) Transcript_71417:361-963(+)